VRSIRTYTHSTKFWEHMNSMGGELPAVTVAATGAGTGTVIARILPYCRSIVATGPLLQPNITKYSYCNASSGE
jgi:hypothetical protein